MAEASARAGSLEWENVQIIRSLLQRRVGPTSHAMFERLLTRCKDEGELIKQCSRWILSRSEREMFLSELNAALLGVSAEWAATIPNTPYDSVVADSPSTQATATDTRWLDTSLATLRSFAQSRYPELVTQDQQTLERVEQVFTEYMGPMARIIIARTRANMDSWDYATLVSQLALQLDNRADRLAFRKKCLVNL